ncbi:MULTISPECIES: MHFG family PEP-CTERM protein [unclassified Roseateles]|uniref:MHFG family PEP-CTERM protein n=1 Tax=unclassified Roseateles TaxID=2626991 RepID=UPI0006F326CB|nr:MULTISPECIES: MHFG family PEP-CTERM protein [unclassified Roseateles]KQW46411.1 hypothetical protein ASC81_08375 [Pelomonas sp. Root405]KRA73461.1 hypothetical protein ASD88_08375 [Pelomonas sp. Root662]
MPNLVSLFLAATLAALAALAVPAQARGSDSCKWRSPGHDPFVGDVPGAVDHYTDIPARTRERLKARMRQFAYDDIVSIRRDAIEGNYRYEPALLDMHFGKRRICGKVTRKTWRADHEERGLAYCEDGQCIVVPLICRNVSRIIRRPAVTARGAPGAPAEPLAFDPPAAGPAVVPAPPASDTPTARTLQAPPTASRMPPAADLPPASTPLPPNPTLPPADMQPPDSPPLATPPVLPPEVPPVVIPPPELPPPVPEPQPPEPNWPAPAIPPLPPAPPVPEPATLLLWATGLAALAAWQRRRRTAVGTDA